jgi:hypothetical protein
MHKAPWLEGVSLDALTLKQDGLPPAEEDIGGRQVLQPLMVAPVVVVVDERLDLGLKVAAQEVVLQQDEVFRLWCQCSISPSVCGCSWAPRPWLIQCRPKGASTPSVHSGVSPYRYMYQAKRSASSF